jgi:hypothetical protein
MAKMRHMTDMELDDDDKLDAAMPAMAMRPDYPYGLRISLTEKDLAKMGLDHEEAEVGGTVHIFGMAEITSVSKTDDGNGKCCRIEMQIQKLGVESEDAENDEN